MSERRKVQVPVHDVPMGTFFTAMAKAQDRITMKRYEVHDGVLLCMVVCEGERIPTVYRLTGRMEYEW